MKKFALAVISVAMAGACAVGFAACTKIADDLVANDATDLLQEDFGIAVKKGDEEVLNAVNAVVNKWNGDGTMTKYFDYYTDLDSAVKNNTALPTAPEGLQLTWDLSSYTETLDLFTEAGFAPYEFENPNGYPVEDGAYNVAGLDIVIACEVAKSLNCKLVIHNVEFDSVIEHLNASSGKAIVAAGLTISEERKQAVDFSNIYSSSTLTIVCDKDAGYTKLADLNGLKIGVQGGTSGDKIATAALSATGWQIKETDDEGNETVTQTIKLSSGEVVRYSTYAAALAALQSGKIDVIFMDKVPAQLLLESI